MVLSLGGMTIQKDDEDEAKSRITWGKWPESSKSCSLDYDFSQQEGSSRRVFRSWCSRFSKMCRSHS